MHKRLTNYAYTMACFVFIFGCGAKNKGKIISERHKSVYNLYLENQSSSESISFTIRKTEQVSSEIKYFISKKNILNNDSTISTSVHSLSPGERKYLGTAQSSDTINLDKDPYDTFVPSADSSVLEGYIPPPRGIHIINSKNTFKIVGASIK